MENRFKKINKEFCITDNSVNIYKYRLLTDGFQLEEFKKNPIGFYMHERDNGVVVRWSDFRVEGDKMFAKPTINLLHPIGNKIADQVENGFINGASVGKIVVLETSDSPKDKLPGQTNPTVTKWFPREISLVDIPGNMNALKNLVDDQNNELSNFDFSHLKTSISTNALDVDKLIRVLKLPKGSEGKIIQSVTNLVTLAEKSDDYKKQLSNLNAISKFTNKTWDELYRSNELEYVKVKFPELYNKLRKEKYNF